MGMAFMSLNDLRDTYRTVHCVITYSIKSEGHFYLVTNRYGTERSPIIINQRVLNNMCPFVALESNEILESEPGDPPPPLPRNL